MTNHINKTNLTVLVLAVVFLLTPGIAFGESVSANFSGYLQTKFNPNGHQSSITKTINLPHSTDYEVRVHYRSNSGTQEKFEEFNVYLDGLLLGKANDPNQGDDFESKSLGNSYFSSGNHTLKVEHAHNYSSVGNQSVYPLEVTFISEAPSNKAPNADAGENKETFENKSVILNGSASDPDGDNLTYNWACNGGSLSNSKTLNPTFNAPSVSQNTTFICTLNVTDTHGAKDSDNVNIYVKKEKSDPEPVNTLRVRSFIDGKLTSGLYIPNPLGSPRGLDGTTGEDGLGLYIRKTTKDLKSSLLWPDKHFKGAVFSHWERCTETVGDSDSESSKRKCYVSMNGGQTKTVDVHYKTPDKPEPDPKFTLNVDVEGSGSVSINPNKSKYDKGTSVKLEAKPSSGWSFVRWEDDLSGSLTVRSLTMNSDKHVTAVFKKKSTPPSDPAILKVSSQGLSNVPIKHVHSWLLGDGGTTNYTREYNKDIKDTWITAPSTRDGHSLVDWDGCNRTANNGTSCYIDSIKQGETRHITVTYKKQSDPEPDPKFTLNIDIEGNGAVNINPNKNKYDKGTSVKLEAKPSSGWEFIRWEDDLSGSLNVRNLTMNSDKNVTAVFKKQSDPEPDPKFTLDVDVEGSGSVSINPNKSKYAKGISVKLEAKPSSGWEFIRWEDDLSGSLNVRSLTMNSNKSVTAVFEEKDTPPEPGDPSVEIRANGSLNDITINRNTSFIISWNSDNTSSCFVQPTGWGGTNGQRTHSGITTDKTFIVTCNGTNGQIVSDSITVFVDEEPTLHPSVNITANPNVIDRGEVSTLIWNSNNTTQCFASVGWSGNKIRTGTQSVSPNNDTTYMITCFGDNGTQVNDQVTIFVEEDDDEDIDLEFRASPSRIDRGDSSRLIWDSDNADHCRAFDGWSGSKSLSGSQTVRPDRDTDYELECWNDDDQVIKTVTIRVDDDFDSDFTDFLVTKTARNITLNQNNFSSFIEAQGNDVVDFEIRIRNTGDETERIEVRDLLPAGLIYRQGSTHIDGRNISDNRITTSGIDIGSLRPGDEVRVRFRTDVISNLSEQTLTNTAHVTGDESGDLFQDDMIVTIRNRGAVLGIGDIPTGPEDVIPLVFIGTFIFSILIVHKRMALG